MVRFRTLFAFLSFILASGAPMAPVGSSWAQSADDFYRGKKELILVTSSSAGGGYDQYSRLVGRYMSRYLPGNPTIIVQNMVGGGGIRAANFIYNVAPRDGSTFSLIDRGMPTAPLMYGDKSRAQFEAVNFSWIGSAMSETGMGVLGARSIVRNIEDAKRHEIFFGATGPETDPAMFARLVNDLLGTRIKSIHGYKGQPEEFQSIEKGELDGLFMSGWSGPGRAYVRMSRGEMRLLVQMATERDSLHADTPAILELVTATEDRAIVEFVLNRMVLGRPFIAPPGVGAERLALLRSAFRRALEDPELHADAEKQKLALKPTWGAEAHALIRLLYATPARVVERTRMFVGLPGEQ
jgi:tripartite-type tricarboxylate transporter receptor subunit TctC